MSQVGQRERSITPILVQRAAVTWLLLRLCVIAASAAAVQGRASEFALFFSVAHVPIVVLLAGIISEIDVRRRHEHALLGNLGLSITSRLVLAFATAATGELVLALVVALSPA